MNFASFPHAWPAAERFQTRLLIGISLSLLAHALLLSLQFGIPGLGLPGLALPWSERRAPAPELSVRLANAQHAPDRPAPAPENTLPYQPPAPAGAETTSRPAPGRAPLALLLSDAPPIDRKPGVAVPLPARPPPARAKARPRILARTIAAPDVFAVATPAPDASGPQATATLEASAQALELDTPAAAQAVTAQPVEDGDTQAAEEKARRMQAWETGKLEEARTQRQALELEAQRQARQTEQAAAAQQRAAALLLQQQAQQQTQAAQKLEEEENARRTQQLEVQRREESKKQEQAQIERQLLEQEARRQAERSEQAARQKQAEQLAAKEQARELAARQREAEPGADDHAAPPPSAAARQDVTEAAGGLAARALAQARQVDDLARAAHTTAADPPAAPRRSVFGSVDRDIGLTMYIESWRLKIERNGALNYAQSSRERARGDPIVTVVIRSDGSVEDIVINRSSGRPELDEAVRRIVRLNARYSSFPPNLARKYDVIEIRRIWNMDDRLRIQEEVR